MSWGEYFIYLGIKLPDAIAGMLGGLVKALMFHRDQPFEAVAATIVGAITANFLGEGVAAKMTEWVPWMAPSRGAACFITGIVAMILCQLLIDQSKKLSAKGSNPNG